MGLLIALYACPIGDDSEYRQRLDEAVQSSLWDKKTLSWFQKLMKRKEEKPGQREKEAGKSDPVHQQQTSFLSPGKSASGSSNELTPPIERKVQRDPSSSHRLMTEQTTREFPKTDSAGTPSKQSQTSTLLPGWLRRLLGNG